MAKRSWSETTAKERIRARADEVRTVEIRDYVRDIDLEGLPTNRAYRVNGVHVYVDILNIDEMLNTTSFEGETCHRRTLRFLNLHFRAVTRIVGDCGAILVDIHNQRLHAVLAKPYAEERGRLHKGVAIAHLIEEVLAEIDEEGDDGFPAAKVRVGIDSGLALAVNNGRRGHREPLFLGEPANQAAKRASGGAETGIYLTNNARGRLGLSKAADEDLTPLSASEVQKSVDAARLPVDAKQVLREWRRDLETDYVPRVEFSAHTPPFANLDLSLLSPANSRRQDALSIYADLDGFTRYVADNIEDDRSAQDVVRTLHVLRSELNSVLHSDFCGCKVRFVGDCIHGVLGEGTSATTDAEETVSVASLCAGAMRSSFDLALAELQRRSVETGSLGLAIGFEYGPVALTRLGIKGQMLRCCISRGVLESEAQQKRCSGTQTALGKVAHRKALHAIADLFGANRVRSGLTYQVVYDALHPPKKQTSSLLRPSVAPAIGGLSFPSQPAGPTKKPPGFA